MTVLVRKGIRFLAVTLALLLVLVLCFWVWPEFVFNARVLRWALDHTSYRDRITWQNLDVDFQPLGWAGKRVQVRAQHFNLDDGAGSAVDVYTLDLGFAFRLGLRGFHFIRLEQLLSRIGSVTLAPKLLQSADRPARGTRSDSDYALSLRVPALGDLVKNRLPIEQIGKVRVQIDQLAYAKWRADGQISTPEIDLGDQRRWEVDVRVQGPDLNARTALSLKAESTNLELAGSGAFDLRFAGNRWRGSINASWSEQLRFATEFQAERGRQKGAPLKVVYEQKRDRLYLSLKTSRPRWLRLPIELASIDCELNARLAQATGEPEQLDLSCPFSYRLAEQSFISQPMRQRFFGGLQVTGEFRRQGPELQLKESSVRLNTAGGELSFDTQIAGRFDADFKQMNFTNARIDSVRSKLAVPNFAWLVRSLDRTIWPIPAPFRTLKGQVEAELIGQPQETTLQIGGRFQTNLHGRRQVVKIDASAETKLPSVRLEDIAPSFQQEPLAVNMDVNLRDVALELPYLNLQTPPRIFPDKRFLAQTAEKPREHKPILLNLRVATTENPVRLYSNLLPDPIALHVNYHVPSHGNSVGKIWLEPLRADIFRRKIRVDRLAIRNDGKGEANPTSIDGQLSYATAEVGVRVYVLGPLSAPRLQFESDPPLTRDQIISVLVFNRSLDDLSEDNQRSAANIGQALSSGALSLTAMYLLASTPVESVQFDPVNQSYSARLRLGQKTTFSLGTAAASDFQTYGIGRRLGKQLSLQTELRRDPAHQTSTVSTMLRWFLRY